MRTLTYAGALNEALRLEMRRDPAIYVAGEDIGQYGGIFGVTKGLLEEFGDKRVGDTPITESAIVGLAVGGGGARRPSTRSAWRRGSCTCRGASACFERVDRVGIENPHTRDWSGTRWSSSS